MCQTLFRYYLTILLDRDAHQDFIRALRTPLYDKSFAPGFLRRLMSMIYESLMLIAVLFIASFIFHLLLQDTSSILFRPAFQLYLLLDGRNLFHLVLDPWRPDIADADLETPSSYSSTGNECI